MSNSIRDLIVSIDFSDIDLRELIRTESAIDEIEDQLRSMGHEIDDVSGEFEQMGVEALLASAATTAALERIEEGAEDAADEVGGLSNAFAFAAIKAVALGAAWTAAAAGGVAAAAPLLLAVGGLGASFAAAGIGVAAFGAVATGAFTEMFKTQEDISKLQEKIDGQSDPKKRAELEKRLANIYKNQSDAQRGALKNLNKFKEFWGGFVNKFEDPIFKAFGTTLNITKQVLKGLEPTITAVAGVVNDLLSSLNQDIKNGGMKEFFDWLETNGAESLRNFATIGGNLMAGFFSILQAFSPIGASMEEGLVGLSEKFKTWADGLAGSTAFQDFVTYAQTNGPVLIGIVSNLWDVFKNLITDLAPLGTIVLEALKNITGEISGNWPAVRETVLALAAGVVTLVAGLKTMQIIGAINALMVAYRTGTIAATLAAWGLNVALLANPFTWVVVGIAALVAAGVALYRNWDTVAVKMNSIWNSIRTGAATAVNAIIGELNKFIQMINKIPGVNIPIVPKVYWGNDNSAHKGGGTDNEGTVSGAYLAAHGKHKTGLSSVPFDNYRALLHRGESVLTAKQSDALRAAGILDTSGKKPSLNAGANVTPTGKAKSGSAVFSPSVTIQVNGASGDAKEIGKQAALAARKELEKLFTQLGMAFE